MTAGELLTPILWVGTIQLAAWEAGERIQSALLRAPGPAAGGALRATFSALLGLVAFSNAALLLAILHGLYAPILLAAVGVLALLGGRRLIRLGPLRGLRPTLDDLPLVFAVAFLCSHLPNALYPVLAHDDNVYHLLLPARYLASHAFDAPVFSLYGSMPHLIEVLYSVPLALGDFVAGKLLAFSIHFWIVAGLAGYVRPRLGRLGGGVASLLYVSGQNVERNLGSAYNEPFLGFFLLGAALAFGVWWETRRDPYLAIVGIACGAACASKYTGWLFAGVILVCSAVAIVRLEPDRARRARVVLLLAAPCGLLLLPWIVGNVVRTGNPVYPNLIGVFGGPYWSEIQALHHWRSLAYNGGLEKDLVSYLLLPLRLVSDGRLFVAPPFSGGLMAVFLIGLVHPRARRGLSACLMAMALGGFLAWAFSVQGGRYLVALVPLMTLAATGWLEGRRLLVGVAVASIGIAIAQRELIPMIKDPGADVFTHSRGELLGRNLNWELCRYLNRVLPPDARVLGLWENRLYFLERPFEADPLYEAPSGLAWLRDLGDPAAFARELAAHGFTHVVVNPGPMKIYLANAMSHSLLDDRVYPLRQLVQDVRLWHAFVRENLEPIPWPGPTLVYRLRPR